MKYFLKNKIIETAWVNYGYYTKLAMCIWDCYKTMEFISKQNRKPNNNWPYIKDQKWKKFNFKKITWVNLYQWSSQSRGVGRFFSNIRRKKSQRCQDFHRSKRNSKLGSLSWLSLISLVNLSNIEKKRKKQTHVNSVNQG